MPPKPRQRRNQREVSVHTKHSHAEFAVNVQGQDPPQPPPSDPNREAPPTNLLLELIQNLQQNQSELAEAIKQLKEKDVGIKTLPQNEGGNQEKPHQDSGSHEKKATFMTMSDVANLLKQEREKNPKEPRLFVKKPSYPTELLKQPYPEKYVVPTFSLFDGRKGSALVHISKFIDSMGAYAGNGDLCLREFSKSLDDRAYTWYTTLPPESVKVWEDMVELFCGKYFLAEEKITLVNLHTTKQANGEDLLHYIHRFRDISLDYYANYEEGELVGVCIDNMLPEFRAHLKNLDISRFAQLFQKARKTALSRKKSNERSFEEPPPPVPCTLEEMMAILNKWVADGVVKLLEVSKKVTEEDKKNPKFCYFHQYVHHSIGDCWTLRRKFHEKIQDGTLELPQTKQRVHTDPFLKHKDRAVVSVVIHGSASDVDMDEPLGLNPEARTTAIKAIMAIAADSGAHCFTAETHANRAFLETTNAITFTDEDMEVQYPDHRRPLYLSATINEVQVRCALVDTGSCIYLIPLSTIQAAKISQKKIQGAPMEIKGFGDVGEYTKGHIQLVLKGRLNGKPIRIAANSTPFDQSESHFVETALYNEITPVEEASLAKPIGIPLPKWEEIKDAPEADLRDLLERKKKRKAEASASKSQPQCESADTAEAAAADPKISAKEELENIKMSFAWQYNEMPGIDPKLVAHSLNVEPGTRPVVQPMRTFHPEVEAQITQEMKKLLSAGFIKPIQHPQVAIQHSSHKEKEWPDPVFCEFPKGIYHSHYETTNYTQRAEEFLEQAVIHKEGKITHSFQMKYPGKSNEVFLAGLADSVWTLKFDGSSTATSAGAGIVLYKYDGEAITKSFKFDFPCSNNATEYEAYLAGLAIAYEMGIKHLRVIGDSNLVVCQARGEFSLKEPSLAPYRALAQKLEAKFSTFEIEHAQRNENRYADALATLGSQIAFEGEEMDVTICKKIEPITESLRKEFEELYPDQEDWRVPIKAKLMLSTVMADLREIKDYTLISGDLYLRLPGGVLAQCISLEEAEEKLSEVHEKICGDGGAASLYRRLQRLGYFWPNMSAKAVEIQSQCPTCQFHYSNEEVCATFVSNDWRTLFLEYLLEGILPSNPKDVYRLKRLALRYFVEGGTLFRKGFHGEPLRCLSPSESQMVMKETHAGECGGASRKKEALPMFAHTCLQNMATPWPFHTWGLDLIGPINQASGGYIWILVATKYFTKWVEAIPLQKATGAAVANFIREHIITRFGIPHKLITDNDTPFINTDVRKVLEHYRVKYRHSTPYYPQGNGQAEATNRMLLRILSKMVFDYRNDWRAHLANVLWAYRSSPKTTIGFTPFSLVYGTDTISPTELVVPSPRVMQGNLEGLDEAKDLTKVKSQRNYQKMANVYSKALRVRIFAEGQMVLKAAEFVRRNLLSPSKFSPNWDGPYIIRESTWKWLLQAV
uniref:Uncharacterized protein n=1 Tax=Fagus sylvatica TaxID=28930 RepID=A0A2N9IY75_FAGSY